MWVATPIGFYSVVARHGDEDAGVSVRARVRTDLDSLIECYLPEHKDNLHIEQRNARDYEFSVHMSHEQWATCMWYASWDITYHNFKDEVTKTQGKERHDVYLKVWGTLRNGLEKISKRPPLTKQSSLFSDDSSITQAVTRGKRGNGRRRAYHDENARACFDFEPKQAGSIYCKHCGFTLASHTEPF